MFDVLESLEWAKRNFIAYFPQAGTEKRYVLKAVAENYAKCVGFVYPTDDDGCVLEHRVRKLAWKITEKGEQKLKEFRDNLGVDGYPSVE